MRQRDMVDKLRDVDGRIGEPELSKIESGLLMPTIPLLKVICEQLGTSPKKLYKNGSLSLASALKKETAYNSEQQFYQFKVRLLRTQYNGAMIDEAIERKGYPSRAAWLIECIDELLRHEKEPALTDSQRT